jgi:hypothetical protein
MKLIKTSILLLILTDLNTISFALLLCRRLQYLDFVTQLDAKTIYANVVAYSVPEYSIE